MSYVPYRDRLQTEVFNTLFSYWNIRSVSYQLFLLAQSYFCHSYPGFYFFYAPAVICYRDKPSTVLRLYNRFQVFLIYSNVEKRFPLSWYCYYFGFSQYLFHIFSLPLLIYLENIGVIHKRADATALVWAYVWLNTLIARNMCIKCFCPLYLPTPGRLRFKRRYSTNVFWTLWECWRDGRLLTVPRTRCCPRKNTAHTDVKQKTRRYYSAFS